MSVAAVHDGRVGPPRWESGVDFGPTFLHWDGTLLWAAGSEGTEPVDDYDWEAQRGGGFVALDPDDGHVVVRGRFDADLAWGNGGVALALLPGALCGFGRRGEVHVFDTRDGEPIATSAPVADGSLGIAHAAVLGEHLVYGFNRGGYRLHTIPIAMVERVVGSRGRFIGGRG